jgi:hypothetical protein
VTLRRVPSEFIFNRNCFLETLLAISEDVVFIVDLDHEVLENWQSDHTIESPRTEYMPSVRI